MAMGLNFSGQGKKERSRYRLLHLAGAAAGGALAGAALGGIGSIIRLAEWRLWILTAAAVTALAFAILAPGRQFGRPRQVPRRWARTMPLGRVFFAWGALLGSGIATLIPYSTGILVVTIELTSGPRLAAAVGASFGLARELLVLIPIARGFTAAKTIDLLEQLRESGRRANVVIAAISGIAILLVVLTSSNL